MRIGELAAHVGVRTSALRYYEQVGLLSAPARVGGRRNYGVDALERLAVLQLAQRCGFTLREVRALFSAGAAPRISQRWAALAEGKIRELDAAIARANAMKLQLARAVRCRCFDVESCGRTIRAAAAKGRRTAS